jgi:uncharacterized protein YyaL (SSP411 family)
VFLLSELRTTEGRLYHTWKDGVAKRNGFLEDYTHLIEGLLGLYQATFDPRWYQAARELAEAMVEHYSAEVGFFDTSDDHETLIVRPRELQDNAVPSGNGMAVFVLQRLAGLAVEPDYLALARGMLGPMQEMLARYPLGFAQWLIALDYMLVHPREVSIVGAAGAADTQALLDVCATGYRPHQVVAFGEPRVEPATVPLLEGRGLVDGRATAYVCIDFVCQRPTTEPEELKALLKSE